MFLIFLWAPHIVFFSENSVHTLQYLHSSAMSHLPVAFHSSAQLLLILVLVHLHSPVSQHEDTHRLFSLLNFSDWNFHFHLKLVLLCFPFEPLWTAFSQRLVNSSPILPVSLAVSSPQKKYYLPMNFQDTSCLPYIVIFSKSFKASVSRTLTLKCKKIFWQIWF